LFCFVLFCFVLCCVVLFSVFVYFVTQQSQQKTSPHHLDTFLTTMKQPTNQPQINQQKNSHVYAT
jgi:hypothetical protein